MVNIGIDFENMRYRAADANLCFLKTVMGPETMT